MTLQRQALGKSGEDLAVEALEAQGYAILERRYRTRHGEIDIVAREGDTLAFVEVKARSGEERGRAAEAVTVGKQRRVVAMAREYLGRHRESGRRCRFDVVAIDGVDDNRRLTLFRGAFDASC